MADQTCSKQSSYSPLSVAMFRYADFLLKQVFYIYFMALLPNVGFTVA